MLHIVTDTTAYLSPELRARWNIHTVPLKIVFNGTATDEDQISNAEFYTRLVQADKLPTTSQPSPGEFIALYNRLLLEPEHEIISIHLSSGLSGTYQTAMNAAQVVAPERITVVDSRAATCALGLIVLKAAQAAAQDASRAEVLALVERVIETYTGIFAVENLEYLLKGGRLNGAAKFLGSVLNVKPILYLNKGKIDGLALARTRKKALQTLIEETAQRHGDVPIHAVITHTHAPEIAEELRTLAAQQLRCEEVHIVETGPVIGAHLGPGMVGIAACPAHLLA